MISIQWGSEEQKMTDSLIKQATSYRKTDLIKAVSLIRQAIEISFSQQYYFKLSLYLCDLNQFEEAEKELKRLLSKFEYDGFINLKNMNRSTIYHHLALIQDKKGDSSKYIYFSCLSTYNYILALATQGRVSELDVFFENGFFVELPMTKFSKHLQKLNLSEISFTNRCNDFLYSKAKSLKELSRIYLETDFFEISVRAVIEDLPGSRDEQYLSLDSEFVSIYGKFSELDFLDHIGLSGISRFV